jgi:hypothetical protein
MPRKGEGGGNRTRKATKTDDEARPDEAIERAESVETDPRTDTVTFRHGVAPSVTGREVTIRQGAALEVKAEEVDVKQGGIGLARAGEVKITMGTVGGVLAQEVELELSAASIVVGREVEMDQAAAGALVADSVRVRDSAIGLLVTRDFQGEGNRVLFGPQAAFAFGAGFGLIVWLLSRLRR